MLFINGNYENLWKIFIFFKINRKKKTFQTKSNKHNYNNQIDSYNNNNNNNNNNKSKLFCY